MGSSRFAASADITLNSHPTVKVEGCNTVQEQRKLEITTNIGCRILCSYCPQSLLSKAYKKLPNREGASSVMTLDMFRRYLESVPLYVDIHFSGFAESWHAEECTEMVTHAHERGHKITVFTTIDGMTERDIKSLGTIPFKRFVVHLPDQFGEMRLKVDTPYLQKLRCLASGPIDNLEFLTIGVQHDLISEAIGRQPSTRRVQSRAGNVDVLGRTVGTAYSEPELIARSKGKSLICRNNRMLSNVLLPNGDVQFCAMDYSLQHTIGNLNEQSYKEIMTGNAFATLFDQLNDPAADVICRKCEYATVGQYRRAAS